MDDVQRTQVLSAAGFGFGVAGSLAPRVVLRMFGVREVSGDLSATMRMLSFRNIALAQVLTILGDDPRLRKRFFTIGAAMFAADTAAAIAAMLSGKVSPRSGLMIAATTGALAAVAASGAAATETA